MNILGRLILPVMILSLLTPPGWADVIPSNIPTDGEKELANQVTYHLETLGVTEAHHDTTLMTSEILAHYADAPGALQVVGQHGPEAGQDFFSGQTSLLSYEFILGSLMLVGGLGAIAYAVKNGG